MANVLNNICYISIIYNAFESKAYASVVPTLNVNGTNILNDDDHRIDCGTGFAEYNPNTQVLTLTNATISQSSIIQNESIIQDSRAGISGN